MDDKGTKRRRNIAENFNPLSRAHERYRQTTDGRAIAVNVHWLRTRVQKFWVGFEVDGQLIPDAGPGDGEGAFTKFESAGVLDSLTS